MKLFEIRDSFGLDHLLLAEKATPEPKAHEVLIRIHAASLNYRDLLLVQGHYNPRLKLPRVPLSDGAGEIVAFGAGVEGWKAGDRVVVPFFPDWIEGELSPQKSAGALGGDVDGQLREFITARADCLLPIPGHLSYEQAAALPCAAVTAWNGLFTSGKLSPGETVLIQGTGGVSLFGLQLAKIAGARVILISSSDAKLERARGLGADETINYRSEPDWEKQVLKLTDGEGVDLTLEVGGTGTLTKTMKATRCGGRISVIGVLTGITGEVQLGYLLHKAIAMNGIYVGSRAHFSALNSVLSQHKVEPVIDQVFPFEDTVSAFRHLESGQHFGKIVIRGS